MLKACMLLVAKLSRSTAAVLLAAFLLFKANMGILGSHSGSWFGLPDFGITEKAASVFSGGGTRDLSNAVTSAPQGMGTTSSWTMPSSFTMPQPVSNTTVPTTNSMFGGPGGQLPQAPQPTVNTNPQPSQPVQQYSGDNWGDIFRAYYPGWNEQAAREDFYRTRGGNVSSFNGGGSGGGGPTPEQIALEKAKGAINSAYDPVFQQLDSLAGMVPEWQQQKQTQLEQLFGSQQGELNTAREGALGKFGGYEQQVAQRQAKGIKDLQQNMNQMLQAGNVYLGTAGAGDSSASPMYAYALSKAAAQGSADISNQAQAMYTELDMKKADIQNTFDQQNAQLNTWKSTQAASITDWAQNLLMQIQNQKATATGQRAAALAAEETGIINQALANLQGLEQQATQWGAQMQQWAMNRLATLDDAKLRIQNSGNFDPANIVQPEIAMSNMPSIQNSAYSDANPYLYQYNKKKQDFNSSF
jgi:hypothetical protein